MGIKKISSSEMRGSATALRTIKDRWDTAYSTLDGLVKGIDGIWDGAASELFKQQWTDEYQKYENLSNLLKEFADFLDSAAQDYDDAETYVHQEVFNH